jgi:hypothetical protein
MQTVTALDDHRGRAREALEDAQKRAAPVARSILQSLEINVSPSRADLIDRLLGPLVAVRAERRDAIKKTAPSTVPFLDEGLDLCRGAGEHLAGVFAPIVRQGLEIDRPLAELE